MTGAEFSGVDVDLLADYVGGALDGTPDAARVADLIVEDPSWRDAHALLAEGVATVELQLRELDAEPEPMPDDVFARLDAALTAASADAGPESTGDDSGATAGGAGMEPGDAGVAPVLPLDGVRNRRRARHLRWAAPIGIAAGVLAFAGFGLQQARDNSSQDAASTTARSAPQEAAPNAAADAGGSDLDLPYLPDPSTRVVSSGNDYRQATLRQVSAVPIDSKSAESRSFSSAKSPAPAAGSLGAAREDALSRLRVQQALLECIDAIATANGAGAVTPRTIDFARYAGSPALVVEFTAGNGTWVWATGAGCGTPAAGADKLAAVKVG